MRKVLPLLLLVLVALGVYWFFFRDKKVAVANEKATALAVQQHSTTFNTGIDSLLNAYFKIKEALVNADSTTAKAAARELITLADSTRLSELNRDTSGIYTSALMQMNDVKSNAVSLLNQTSITEIRQDFRMIGENIYPLLKTINYEGKPLYWQNCPMAFGDDQGANWISSTAQIVNPYLGKNHPEFKGTMLHCGEVKDSIIFAPSK
ncbi:MAG: DUF3347 domain-containing protein [Ferruginibacter sp.]|nr:DUF3347 domain-containing protein [Ferruginibacter sp.]